MGLQYELPSAVPQSIESWNMRLCCTAGSGERLTHRAQHIQRWSAATPTVLGPQPRLAQLLALQHAQDLSRKGQDSSVVRHSKPFIYFSMISGTYNAASPHRWPFTRMVPYVLGFSAALGRLPP
jgi:hypothetical protein